MGNNLINIKLETGEWLSLIGTKKSGKSQLLELMNNLLLPPQKTLLLDGKAIRTQSAVTVLEKFNFLPPSQKIISELTVKQLAKLGCASSKYCQSNAEKALSFVGMTKFSEYQVDSLSEYERQKAFLTLALTLKIKFLLLDGVTNNLDICHQLELLEIFKQMIINRGMTIVTVLDDINLAARYSTRVALLHQGMVLNLGKPETVLNHTNLLDALGVNFAIINTPFGLQFCPLTPYN